MEVSFLVTTNRQVLSDGMEYDCVKNGMSLSEAKKYLDSKEGKRQEEYIKFAQEKYSNGETSLQYYEEYLQPLQHIRRSCWGH